MSLRCVIVDDEELARQRVRELLQLEPDTEVIGEAADGDAAVALINDQRPDLVWLDIRMPGCDGFEVLGRLDLPLPVIVFVTAYDEYAIRAFDTMALDYVLKPFDRGRLQRALARAREAAGSFPERVATLLAEHEHDFPRRMIIREAGRIQFVQVDDIRWIEAQGNYLKLYTGTGTPLLRCTMKDMEARLDPQRFARVHRSTIVCLSRIRQMRPISGGDYKILLDDSTELVCSRGHVADLLARCDR